MPRLLLILSVVTGLSLVHVEMSWAACQSCCSPVANWLLQLAREDDHAHSHLQAIDHVKKALLVQPTHCGAKRMLAAHQEPIDNNREAAIESALAEVQAAMDHALAVLESQAQSSREEHEPHTETPEPVTKDVSDNSWFSVTDDSFTDGLTAIGEEPQELQEHEDKDMVTVWDLFIDEHRVPVLLPIREEEEFKISFKVLAETLDYVVTPLQDSEIELITPAGETQHIELSTEGLFVTPEEFIQHIPVAITVDSSHKAVRVTTHPSPSESFRTSFTPEE